MKKHKKNLSVAALRKILNKTQRDFAECVGVSHDTIVSVENGRNPMTQKLAQRIRVFCGVHIPSLMDGSGILLDSVEKQYTAQTFEYWKQNFAISTERAAEENFNLSQDALLILFQAAAKPGQGRVKNRLPAVYMSFIEWAEETRKIFNLDGQIKQVLEQRKCKDSLTMSYADWRSDKAGPDMFASFYGFKDNTKKSADEDLTLTITSHPGWTGAFGNMKRSAERKRHLKF